ncbi:MAG TPA: hypothetical protein VF432_15525 [Thermoanaerobaculia bacterium]
MERFIRERLPSSEQIDIVLLLRADRERAWSAPEVSQHLGTPPESTAMRLFLLASNGVVAFDGSGGIPRYRHTTHPESDALIAELAAVYEATPSAVYAIVGTPVRDPLRSFADAFKLKK